LQTLPAVQFSSTNYSVNEGEGRALITVTRTGDTTGITTVDYLTVDNDDAVSCDVVNGTAYPRCDYATTIDTLRFAAGETQKTFTVPIIDDAHVEGVERLTVGLSSPTGATLGTPGTSVLTIVDNDSTAAVSNPVFTQPFFVRQQYLDFLTREPETDGFGDWLSVLNNCPDVNSDPSCDRIHVSQAFFGSQEFQLKGYYVYRFYKLAFNRLPQYAEIIADTRRVTGPTAAEVFQKKAAFATAFTQRAEFTARYGALSHAAYVAALMGRYNLTSITTPDPANPDGTAKVTLTTNDLTNRLSSATSPLTRAQVLRAIGDSDQVFQLEFNQAFVAMQYYGYLRRTPEPGGYNDWLTFLNAHPADFRSMVNGFMNSIEYRLRFGTDVRGDLPPPRLVLNPFNGVVLSTTTPLIEVTFSNAPPGVDTSTLVVKIDNLDFTRFFTLTNSRASYVASLGGGLHTVEASVRDRAGNLTTTSARFTVSAFRALPEASPASGVTPLAVNFITKAVYTDGAITHYRWDFQGDGIFDTDDPGARNYTRTFTQRGTFNAVLEVTNDKNEKTSATVPITVQNNPPTATASINPSNGAVPLTVNFTGSGTDPDGTITKFEWDFDGDGTFDFASATTGNTSHTYNTAGTFNARFRVTDNDGQTTTASATTAIVRPGPPGSPTATITSPANTLTGNAPLTVNFNGTGADTGGTITKYEWDFNGDGAFDFSSPTSAATSFKYDAPGAYTAALRVTDNSGLTGIDAVDIIVNAVVTLSLSTDTCKPLDGGTIDVRTTLGGTLPVTLFFRDKAGQTVRTLVNNATRAAGSFVDKWDCKNGGGQVVPEGVYYAILQYTVNGQPRTLDLTNTTGGAFFNPSWTMSTTGGTSSCTACPFKPLEDNFLKVDFTLVSASEVTVSIRLFNSINEVAGLFDRKVFGRGTYTVFWDGTDPNGRIVAPPPSESQFIWGMTGFTLPTNAVFVETAPQITSVAADPNYFDPATGNFISPQKPTTKVAYTLTKQANVTLQVFRTGTNTLMRTVTQLNAAAGAGTIEWDGRADNGLFADKGDYRLALKATDAAGNQSIVRYVLVRVFY
jgi:PKD repeat protein